MNYKVLATAAAVLLLAADVAGAQSTRPTTAPATTRPAIGVRVLAVDISRDIPAALQSNNLVRTFAGNRSSNQGPVQILLAVTPADGRIVEADPGDLNVKTFLDDTYQDLRLMDARRNPYAGNNNGANVAADGSVAVYWIQSERAPAEKAERMLLRGDLLLKTTSAERKTDRLPLALRVGETIKVADATLSVASVSLNYASGRAGEPQTVRGVQMQLRSDDDLDFIRDTAFYDGRGEKLDVNTSNRGSRGEGQPATLSFYLPRLEEGVTVQFTYAEAVREQRVPFEVQIDLGTARVGETPEPAEEKPAEEKPAEEPQNDAGASARPVVPDAAFGVPRARLDWAATPARAVAFPDRSPATWAAIAQVIEPGETPSIRPGFAARAPFPTTRPREAVLPTLEGASVRAVALGVGTVPSDAAGEWPVNPAALFQPFGGTQVQLLANVPGRRIAGVETKLLTIDAFTDDTGATLATTLVPTAGAAERLKHTADPHYEVGGGADAAVREDGGAALLAFALADAPTSGAKQFRVRGRVPVAVADSMRTLRVESKPLRVGASLAPPEAGFTATVEGIHAGNSYAQAVAFIGRAEFESYKMFVRLELKGLDPRRLVGLRVLDGDDGRPLITIGQQPNYPAAARGGSFPETFWLPSDTQKVTLEWDLLGELITADLPFDVTLGVGL